MAARCWKDGARQGIAYVENAEIAERVMALRANGMGNSAAAAQAAAPRKSGVAGTNAKKPHLPPGAMAVYADKKGKPFAWQIAFALRDWETVTALLGVG